MVSGTTSSCSSSSKTAENFHHKVQIYFLLIFFSFLDLAFGDNLFYFFPADFVVMDVEEDHEVPVILGRPFMSTASCIIDMGRKTLEMGFEDQKINFDLFEENKSMPEHNVCLQVMEVEEEVLKVTD